MSDGLNIPIETIQAGDCVRTSVGGKRCAAVETVTSRRTSDLRELVLRRVLGESRLPETIRLGITGDHRVWTDGEGWKAVAEVKPGERLHYQTGAIYEVLTSERIKGEHTVFSLDVRGDNAFFAEGLLVHDLCGMQDPSSRSIIDSGGTVDALGKQGATQFRAEK